MRRPPIRVASRGKSVALAGALLVAACASLPPGADFPKTESRALDHPETTALGRVVEPRAQEHRGLSGFRLVARGSDGFALRAEMVDAAQRTIDAQYFVFQSDASGLLLQDALLRAAKRGVRVRILIDDTQAEGQNDHILLLAAESKIDVRLYNPFAYRGSIGFIRATEFLLNASRLNYRMHNKLLIVDNEIGLAGGRNVGDEYFETGKQYQFGDYDIFAMGPIVRDLSASFDTYWNSALSIPAEAVLGKAPGGPGLEALEHKLATNRSNQSATELAQRADEGAPLDRLLESDHKVVWAKAEAIYDSPDKADSESAEHTDATLRRRIMQTARAVRKELVVVSPYFIPGDSGMRLFDDLRKRGVRVRVLTNSLASTDVPLVHAAYSHYRRPLLADGVELYEARPVPGAPHERGGMLKAPSAGQFALHAKVFVFDRQRIFIGSANFDRRSSRLNTEFGLLIDSPELAQQVIERFETIAQPANSYVLALSKTAIVPQIVWRTEENGRPIEYTHEPDDDGLRVLKAEFLSWLPLDDEL